MADIERKPTTNPLDRPGHIPDVTHRPVLSPVDGVITRPRPVDAFGGDFQLRGVHPDALPAYEEPHPLLTREEFMDIVALNGDPEAIGVRALTSQISGRLIDNADLIGDNGRPSVNPSERLGYTVPNGEGQPTDYVSLPNIAAQLDVIPYEVPKLGHKTTLMLGAIVNAFPGSRINPKA